MMKPFPFVLGTDIIHMRRIDPLKRSSHFVRLARRILHRDEFAVTRKRFISPSGEDSRKTLYDWLTVPVTLSADGSESSSSQSKNVQAASNVAAKWLAGRWAAKEAAKKAWGANLLGWKDVRVQITEEKLPTNSGSKAVSIVCQPHHEHGDDFATTEAERSVRQEGLLSISHDGEYSVATVMAEPLDAKLLAIFRSRAELVKSLNEERRREVAPSLAS